MGFYNFFRKITQKFLSKFKKLKEKKIVIDDFRLLKTIGRGSFGRVFFAKYITTDDTKYVAIKRLKKADLIEKKQVDHVLSEKKVKYITSFVDSRYIYMVLEYIPGGEFFRHLRICKSFTDDAARFYAAQVVTVFEYLHSLNIVYRDLKPENLLLARDGYLKFTDFGFSKFIENRTYTFCGTPEYIAPEILLNSGHSTPVDWWTLGIFIYEILVGYPPFIDNNTLLLYKKIINGKVIYPPSLSSDISQRYGNLKGGVDDIKQHKWFINFDWNRLLQKKLVPPIRPIVKNMDDTSNFDDYSESFSFCKEVQGLQDPFKDW